MGKKKIIAAAQERAAELEEAARRESRDMTAARDAAKAIQEGCQETKGGVSGRHRREWLEFRLKFLNPLYENGDGEAAKFARAVADILKIYQEGERKAWGFGEGGEAESEMVMGWEA